jgi:hypothetical protein
MIYQAQPPRGPVGGGVDSRAKGLGSPGVLAVNELSEAQPARAQATKIRNKRIICGTITGNIQHLKLAAALKSWQIDLYNSAPFAFSRFS